MCVKQIYLLTELFPDKERFGLCSQIQRTSVSIVSNIAEGTLIALNSRSFPNSLSRMSGRGSWFFVSNKELYPGKNKTFIAFETLHHLPLVRKRGGVE